MKKRIVASIAILEIICLIVAFCAGCRQADRVSINVSKEADNFNVVRKITVFNTRTDSVLFEMLGTMSISNSSNSELEVICKTGEDQYKKHFVYLCDWTTYIIEDISGAAVDPYHYEIIFFPKMLPIVDVDIRG